MFINIWLDTSINNYVFFTNRARYDYAKEAYPDRFSKVNKILLSNIKTEGDEKDKKGSKKEGKKGVVIDISMQYGVSYNCLNGLFTIF